MPRYEDKVPPHVRTLVNEIRGKFLAHMSPGTTRP